jgi:ribosome-associated toxin RatA of RatAB toxin-antitoxin module
MADVTVETVVAAAPKVLYDLVSDVTRMGEWSPETTSCRWLGDATGPTVGARFVGANCAGWRRWATTCKVRAADPGERFEFEVSFGPLPVSTWAYEFEPEGAGCRVRETWTDRRLGWMRKASPYVMGVRDWGEHNRGTMEATLAALRQHAEKTG